MTHIVYILGAGFSAPLGLPLVPNFLLRAKDLYFSNPQKFAQFEAVFKKIDKLAATKNYFIADLFNIEEILSILEMEAHFSEGPGRHEFIDFLISVISAYTPPLAFSPSQATNWVPGAFGNTDFAGHYGFFVASLCGMSLRKELVRDLGEISIASASDRDVRYSVITLNYDMVLEQYCDHLHQAHRAPREIGFGRNAIATEGSPKTPLIKLHGSVDTKDVVPPTWSKSVHKEILPAWKAAFSSLSTANHLRFIGYSLPDGDSYIRYLLKSALPKSTHLKSIHALCLDHDGQVKKRYSDFFTFNFFDFRSERTERYLAEHFNLSIGSNGQAHKANQLERAHKAVFDK